MEIEKNHPCFDADARARSARIHLAVAPTCNVQCNFCDRQFDCVSESRPGTTSKLLKPEEAQAHLRSVVARRDDIAVVGIAGPGDPMATPELTLETFERVRRDLPSVMLCLSTNGLGLEPHLPALSALRLSHLTITINAVDPAIGAQIYEWVGRGPNRLRGEDGAKLLLERQLRAVKAASEAGLTVKVNTVVTQGVNDQHLQDIAHAAKEHGAHIMNAMALIPVAGTAFANEKAPSHAEMKRLRRQAEHILPQMAHCARCRSDAVGLLASEARSEAQPSEDGRPDLLRPGTVGFASEARSEAQPSEDGRPDLLRPGTVGFASEARSEAQPSEDGRPDLLRPGTVERRFVAVASREGVLVNQHLGEATELAVYAEGTDAFELVDVRRTPPAGGGEDRWFDLADLLEDCRAVLVSGAGRSPVHTLKRCGIQVIQIEGLLEDALEVAFSGRQTPSHLAPRVMGCGSSCGGNRGGCAA